MVYANDYLHKVASKCGKEDLGRRLGITSIITSKVKGACAPISEIWDAHHQDSISWVRHHSLVVVSLLVVGIAMLLSRGRRIFRDGVTGAEAEATTDGTAEVRGPGRDGVRTAFFPPRRGFLSFFSASSFSATSTRSRPSVFGNSSSLSFLFLPLFSLVSGLVITSSFRVTCWAGSSGD